MLFWRGRQLPLFPGQRLQDAAMTRNPPAIILVRPQLGQNIGMAARAMANFALDDLRLVAPRDGWPNPDAGPAAAGADALLDSATVAESITEAAADCTLLLATTIRPREARLPVYTPRDAADHLHAVAARGQRAGILFGPERSGLTADDIAPAHGIITCPVQPGFGSLNLAQAVLLVAYEWFQHALGPASPTASPPALPVVAAPADAPATAGEIAGLVAHLTRALETAGYFHPRERAPAARRALANILARAQLGTQDVRTLRGVVASLETPRKR
jgi:tRNA/rRNA methyltransferase